MLLFSALSFILYTFPSSLVAQDISEMRTVGKAIQPKGELVDLSIRDVNGDIAGAIIVLTDLENLAFNSRNGVIKVNEQPGKYVVFLSPSERVLTVLASGYKPLTLYLYDLDIRVRSGEVWQIELTGEKPKDELPVTFKVRSPENAQLLIDGSPVDLSKSVMLEEGEHQVRIEKEGYETKITTVNVTKESTFFEFSLNEIQPVPFTIRTVPSEATLFIDDRLVGNSPFTDFYFPGIYTITIANLNMTNQRYTLELPSQGLDTTFFLQKEVGSIFLSVTPKDAIVTVNNSSVDHRKPLELAEGKYQLKVEKEGFQSYSEVIQVQAMEAYRKNIQLTPKTGRLIFQTSDPDVQVSMFQGKTLVSQWKGLRRLRDIAVGDYILVMEKIGYEPQREEIVIKDGETTEYSFLFNERSFIEDNTEPTIPTPVKTASSPEKKRTSAHSPIKHRSDWIYRGYEFSSFYLTYVNHQYHSDAFESTISTSNGIKGGVNYITGIFIMGLNASVIHFETKDDFRESDRLESYVHSIRQTNVQPFLGLGLPLLFLYPHATFGFEFSRLKVDRIEESENVPRSRIEMMDGVLNIGLLVRLPGKGFGATFGYSRHLPVNPLRRDDLPEELDWERFSGGITFYF